MHLFYTPDITTNEYTLPEEESKHCIKVLRLEVGNEIFLIDGKGGFYRCEIIQAQPKRCEVRCVEKTEEYGKRAFHIHIAIAPTKNIERIEWFLEKCTEIGIDEITPLLCDHSERKVIKEDRLEKVIISAMKQSLKAYLPKLNPLTEFSRFVKIHPRCNVSLIVTRGIKNHFKKSINPAKTSRSSSARRETFREMKSHWP